MDTDLIAEAKTQAAGLVTDAVKTAEEVVRKATGVAERLLDDREERTSKILSEALKDAFGENLNAGRFIDITRVPLLCQSVIGIHADMKEMKDMLQKTQDRFVSKDEFIPYKIAGAASIIALVGGFFALLLK